MADTRHPNEIVDYRDYADAPDPTGNTMLRRITYADGRVRSYAYDRRTPPPKDTPLSQPYGVERGGGVNSDVRDAWRKQEAAQGKPPSVRGSQRAGYAAWNEETQQYE